MKNKLLILSFISLMTITCAGGAFFSNESKIIPTYAEEPDEGEPKEEEEESEYPEEHGTLLSSDHTLNVLNVQDYIGLDVIAEFEEFANKKYGVSDVHVNYEPTDTPETMFNNVKLTPAGYDLICPSDYMIQKLIVNDMITPLDKSLIPYYYKYASRYIKEKKLDPITAVNSVTGKTEKVGDYAVGYMWGTLGMVFDPIYGGRDEKKFISDMQSWDIMWNSDYNGIGTVKDSVRDTYAIGLLHGYDKDFVEDGISYEGFDTLQKKFQKGELTADEYNEKFSALFNRCDDKAIDTVRTNLDKLLGNVFGLEVDQGKQDIVLGKIGINFAWSGDAVYSLDLADDGNKHKLYYSIPQNGSNAWFDAWVMPKYEQRSAARVQLAHDFLNFLSRPAVAEENMDETGYTSFIGGDTIRDLALDWYDARTDLIYFETEGKDEKGNPITIYNSVYYEDPITGEETEAWYEDCHFVEDADPDYDNVALYYKDENDVSHPMTDKYNARFVIDPELEEVDLSYFFEGTLSEEDTIGATFYSDCYLPFYNEDGSHNECVGRQFFTQYPDENTLSRCAVMKDFGAQNDKVMAMWEKFRSTSLPTWAIILFSVEVAGILFCVGFYLFGKYRKASFKKRRKK